MALPRATSDSSIADLMGNIGNTINPILALVAQLIAYARAAWAAFKAGNPTAVVDALTGKFYKNEAEALADGALKENLKTELPEDAVLIKTFSDNAKAGKVEAREAAEWAKTLIPSVPIT